MAVLYACVRAAGCVLLLQYTTKLPPPKRAKVASPAAQLQKQLAAANASRTLAGKPGELLHACMAQLVALAVCSVRMRWHGTAYIMHITVEKHKPGLLRYMSCALCMPLC
jgi:hypothetical protein